MFNLTSFTGTGHSHNFLKLTENSYTVLEEDNLLSLPFQNHLLHIQTSLLG